MFRVNRKLKCVQSLQRHSCLTYTTLVDIQFSVKPRCEKTLVASNRKLNILQLFHSSSYHSSKDLQYVVSNPQKSVTSSIMESKIVKELVPSQLMDLDSDSDEDKDEKSKQDIWSVGPVPVPTFNFAAYANDSEIIKKLVDLGVDLSKLENKQDVLPLILKLDYEQHVSPCIKFLSEIGIRKEILGWYVTKNPFIFKEDIRNLNKRLDYLKIKEFSPESILRIISVNPFWLSFNVTRIDRRLEFFSTFFHLDGNKVRTLATRGPKLITSSTGRVKDVTFKVVEEMGFTKEEMVTLLIEKPRIWMERPNTLWKRFDYLHNEVNFSHEDIVRCPDLLGVRESRLKNRIGFLRHNGKAQFDPEKPNYVSFKMIYSGDDTEFVTKVAKRSVLEYNDYMKSL